jgi:hypothetical protein
LAGKAPVGVRGRTSSMMIRPSTFSCLPRLCHLKSRIRQLPDAGRYLRSAPWLHDLVLCTGHDGCRAPLSTDFRGPEPPAGGQATGRPADPCPIPRSPNPFPAWPARLGQCPDGPAEQAGGSATGVWSVAWLL